MGWAPAAARRRPAGCCLRTSQRDMLDVMCQLTLSRRAVTVLKQCCDIVCTGLVSLFQFAAFETLCQSTDCMAHHHCQRQ